MAALLDTFIADCTDLLCSVEDELLKFERPGDPHAERVHRLFRAVHTLKGNASMVGQAQIEWFAQVIESVLDRVRRGALSVEPELITLLLAAVDHLRFLVGVSAMGEGFSPSFAEADRARLIGALAPYLDESVATAVAPRAERRERGPDRWHIAARFSREVLRNGLDPLYFLRHLNHLGQVSDVICHTGNLPTLAEYDPEACYLHFSLTLETLAEKSAIAEAFALVRNDCTLRILPSPQLLADQCERLQALPEDCDRIGDMLVQVGAVTASEVCDSLGARAGEAAAGDPAVCRRLGEVLVEQGKVAAELVQAAMARQERIAAQTQQEGDSVRVPRDALEQILQLVANLAGVSRNAQRYSDRVSPALAGELAAMDALTSEAMEEARRLLSLRAGEAFRRVHRLVRDLSQKLDKPVELLFEGENVLLDRLHAERLGEIVLHLVRNAMDHGFENPAERAAAGKRARGCLRISVSHEGKELVMRFADDGRGIDTSAVRRAAIERGVLSPDARRSERELLELVFSAGLSTRMQADNLSGRGVGLDVVRTQVRQLGGQITVSTRAGEGTTFTLRLPVVSSLPDSAAFNIIHHPARLNSRAA